MTSKNNPKNPRFTPVEKLERARRQLAFHESVFAARDREYGAIKTELRALHRPRYNALVMVNRLKRVIAELEKEIA
jgi:hypothetical protein